MSANKKTPTGAGKSSYGLIDAEKFFQELDLAKGITFLDVACGRGAYCLAASDVIGSYGRIYGVDLWQEGIELLRTTAKEKGAENITAFVSDVSRRIPVEDQSIDVCLMATVLHDFVEDHVEEAVLKEIARVVKTGGTLAVVEFKKTDGPPGPPKAIRLSPEEVTDTLFSCGFEKQRVCDLGDSTYLIMLRRS